jgi:Zn-dependent protease
MAELVALALVIVCHEAGHAAAAQAAGLDWKPIARLPWRIGIGVVIPEGGLHPRDELRIALAGPAASIMLAIVTFGAWRWLGVYSGLVAAANLLPFPGSDGMRAAHAVRLLAAQAISASAR